MAHAILLSEKTVNSALLELPTTVSNPQSYYSAVIQGKNGRVWHITKPTSK